MTNASHIRPGDEGFVPYANGVTYVSYCIECGSDATEMVGPESLCSTHAAERKAERAKSSRWAAEWAASPEGRAEIARENALERRYS